MFEMHRNAEAFLGVAGVFWQGCSDAAALTPVPGDLVTQGSLGHEAPALVANRPSETCYLHTLYMYL